VADRRRTRFVDSEKILHSLGEGWPSIFDPATLEAMRLELEDLPWGAKEDATLAWAAEHAGIAARRLRPIVDSTVQLNVLQMALVRGRVRLDEHRRHVRVREAYAVAPGLPRLTVASTPRGNGSSSRM
jgi:hypothetical protein